MVECLAAGGAGHSARDVLSLHGRYIMAVPCLRSVGRGLLLLPIVVFAAFLVSCSGNDTTSTTTLGSTTTSSTGATTTETGAPGVTGTGGSLPETPPPPAGNEYAEQLPKLEEAVAQNPNDLDALAQLAIGYYQTQDYAKAEETYKKMLAIKDTAEVHNNLANVYRDSSKPEQAIEEYEKALDLDPSLGVAYGNLAFLYMMSGQTDKAITTAENGIEKTSGPAREQLQSLLDTLR